MGTFTACVHVQEEAAKEVRVAGTMSAFVGTVTVCIGAVTVCVGTKAVCVGIVTVCVQCRASGL